MSLISSAFQVLPLMRSSSPVSVAGYLERWRSTGRRWQDQHGEEWRTMSSQREAYGAYGIAPPGFRLPEETHAGTVRLQVSDLARSLVYYQQVIGLQVRTATPDAAILGSTGDDRPLVALHARPGVAPARRGAFGLYHFAILLPDRAALGRFAAHVGALGVRVGMADHLVSEALYLWDPDGLGIEVYADRPRETWRHRDRELVMTTDPLGLDDVIAAAGGRPWEGMPAGTTIGHVHLRVGSLDEADAFYHRALGFDRMVWSYPGALFLAAGGYHHHLGTNTWAPGPRAGEDEARLLDWELVLPDDRSVAAAAESLRAAAYVTERSGDAWTAADPWGTRLRLGVRS
jgi:catechol 2,3-dioxygenase